MKQKSALLLLLIFAAACIKKDTQAEELYDMMQGTFISENQAKENPKYHNITLQLAHIWEDREGRWVYAEYTVSKAPEQPFSQRIYKISESEIGRVEVESFEIQEAGFFAGKWKEPSTFDILTRADLSIREDCELVFRKSTDAYIGETQGKNCSRGLGKADYSTHQLRVSEDQVIHWARGFDQNDELVYGLSDGGYVLDRVETETE